MVTVILFGKADDNDVEGILSVLSPYNIMTVKNGEIVGQKNPKLLLIFCEKLPKIKIQSGILAAVGNFSEQGNFRIPKCFRGLVGSEEAESLAFFKKLKIPTLTFGMSNEDSLVLSGVRDHSASVCLQRGLVTLNGRRIEPREYPSKIESTISYKSLLIAYGILLLADIEPI